MLASCAWGLLLWFRHRGAPEWARRLSRRARRLVASPVRSAALLALLGASLVLVSFAAFGPPVPTVQDEFSYLLGAETFAGGRLANPSPPSPDHFEQPHVLIRPSRASKYPPGQSLILGASQAITGKAWLALPLYSAFLAVTAFWMLSAWLPRRWAFWASLYVVVGLGLGHWQQSYWGGTLAAIGGGLLFGGLRRILASEDAPLSPTLLLFLGIGLLAVSRPWEGMWITLLAGAVLLVQCLRHRRVRQLFVVTATGLAVLAPGAALLAVHNRAVTGDPLTLPYRLYQERNLSRPLFVWQEERPPREYANPAIAGLFSGYRVEDPDRPPLRVAAELFGKRLPRILVSLLGVTVLPGLILAFLRPGDRWTILGLFLLLGGAAASAVTWSWWPHYDGPLALLAVALAVLGTRAVTGSPALLLLLVLPRLAVSLVEVPAFRPDPDHWTSSRTRLTRELERSPGKDLVFVPQTVLKHTTWTHNPANLGEAEVLWVWNRGADENRELLRAFPERTVWYLEGQDLRRRDGENPHRFP